MNVQKNQSQKSQFWINRMLIITVMVILGMVLHISHNVSKRLNAQSQIESKIEEDVNLVNHINSFTNSTEYRIKNDESMGTQASLQKLSQKLKRLENELAEFDNDSEDNKLTPDELEDLQIEIQEEQSARQAKADAEITAYVSMLDNMVISDQSATDWSVQAEETLNQYVNEEDWQGLEIVDASCGSEVCRAEIYVDNLESMREDIENFSENIPWNAEMFINVPGDTDPGKAVVFISRGDNNLPSRM